MNEAQAKIDKIKVLLESIAKEVGECRRILKGETEA
jgi:hypothetical protein